MDYQEALSFIHNRTRKGSQKDLTRLRAFLESVGNPQNELKFVHIGGTNGKGSVTTLISNSLSNSGFKVGRFMSPYINDFRERIAINDEMISEDMLCRVLESLIPTVEEFDRKGLELTEFELVTAAAFLFFKEEACDIVCLEVGLGGRNDATNVIETTVLSVITSISLDHVDILGNTIYDIAKNKAGIIKRGANVVSYPLQEAEATAAFFEEASKKRVKVITPNSRAVSVDFSDETGSEFSYGGEVYRLSLVGGHQVMNAITAIEALNELGRIGFPTKADGMKKAFSEAHIPARFEVLQDEPYFVFDGGHNEQGMKAYLDSAVKTKKRPIVMIIGMLSTKDYKTAIETVSAVCDFVLAVPVPYPTTVSPKEIALIASKNAESFAFADCGEAVSKALSLAGKEGIIISGGSFYLANEIKNALKKQKPTT